MSSQSARDLVQEMYARIPAGTRATFTGDEVAALAYYRDFRDFVRRVAPPGPRKSSTLLDVGCGCGWSSYAFLQEGYTVTGVDLNPDAFEPPPAEGLTLLRASALDLPFPEGSFDVVATNACLEHIPDPEAALAEMVRVCRPGGIVVVVGPNLLTPFFPIRHLVGAIARGERIALRRTPTMARHPYGDTLTEHLISIPATTARLARKLLSPKPSFTLRDPDTAPPFHADNDACYLCNPTDLLRFFPRHGCTVVRAGRHGRPPLSYLFATGTWVAAKKLG